MLVSRRRALKEVSIGGMSLAMASCLRSIQAHAAGDEKTLPKRFVFVVKSSGIDKFNLVPDGLENHFIDPENEKKLGNRGRRPGPLVDVSPTDRQLP